MRQHIQTSANARMRAAALHNFLSTLEAKTQDCACGGFEFEGTVIHGASCPRVAPALRRQSGFTLIELMIVVAIVGILAVLALYSYSSYTTRAAASEGVQMADGMKTAVAENYESTGTFPTNLAAAGLSAPVGKYTDPTLSGVVNGTIEIAYLPTAPGALAGTVLAFTPYYINGGGIAWTCGYAVPPVSTGSDTWTLPAGAPVSSTTTTTPPQYLPASCRSNG